MQLALIQMQPALLAVADNLARAERLIEQAGAADLYLLPELFPSGYTFQTTDEVAQVAEPAGSGPTFDVLSRIARRRNAAIVYGFAERRGNALYNSANVIAPEGLITTYRKIHLFGREKLFFSPGDAAPPVVDLACGRVGVMVCFDWYFPEVARTLALRGAELIVQPANLVLPHCPDAMITRSLENRVFTATCDRVGAETNGDVTVDVSSKVTHTFIGMSQVVNPRGEVLVRLSRDREETAVVSLDLTGARSKQLGQHNDLFADRQPALYS